MLLARERSDPAGERAMRAAGAGASGLHDLGEEHNDYLAESSGRVTFVDTSALLAFLDRNATRHE